MVMCSYGGIAQEAARSELARMACYKINELEESLYCDIYLLPRRG